MQHPSSIHCQCELDLKTNVIIRNRIKTRLNGCQSHLHFTPSPRNPASESLEQTLIPFQRLSAVQPTMGKRFKLTLNSKVTIEPQQLMTAVTNPTYEVWATIVLHVAALSLNPASPQIT
jgi:hypothetical protein